MTKKEMARLVRIARSAGMLQSYAWGAPKVASYICPVHREALTEAGERGSAHRFEVYPVNGSLTSVAAVTEYLQRHLDDAEEDEEPCSRLKV